MKNDKASNRSDIGWKDVLDLASIITLFLCYTANKHVSGNPWALIAAGVAATAVGACYTAYRRKLKREGKKTGGVFWYAIDLFIGISFIAAGVLEAIAQNI